MPTPTMVGGQTRPPHSITLSITKRLTAATPSAGISICRNEPFSEPEPFGIISISTVSSRVVEIDMDDRHAGAARGLLVLARDRMHHRGAQRMLLGGALAAAADRFLHRRAVELDVAADGDVVDRNAGVLAEQVLGALGDRDVLDHGAEDGLAGGVGFLTQQPLEALLDIARQQLERADIERLAELLDFLDIELHGVCPKIPGRAGCDQQHGQRLAEAPVVQPAVELPADPGSEQPAAAAPEATSTRPLQSIRRQHDTRQRHRLHDDDVGLVDARAPSLRPAAQLRPDRRQNAGIAADAAENAADEADACIGDAAAGLDGVQAWREQRVGSKRQQEHAEHHFENAGIE